MLGVQSFVDRLFQTDAACPLAQPTIANDVDQCPVAVAIVIKNIYIRNLFLQ